MGRVLAKDKGVCRVKASQNWIRPSWNTVHTMKIFLTSGSSGASPAGLPREQNLGRALYNSHTPSRSLEYFCIFELADTVRVSIHLKFFISRIFFDRFFHLFFRSGERFFAVFDK